MRCGCGNELRTGDFEGICIRCKNAMNQAKQWSQNLPKADVYSLLADVRALKREIDDDDLSYTESEIFDYGYNQAIDDVLQKLSEHFS